MCHEQDAPIMEVPRQVEIPPRNPHLKIVVKCLENWRGQKPVALFRLMYAWSRGREEVWPFLSKAPGRYCAGAQKPPGGSGPEGNKRKRAAHAQDR